MKKILFGLAGFGIALASIYFASPYAIYSSSPSCRANPGWTLCEESSNNAFGIVALGSFLSLLTTGAPYIGSFHIGTLPARVMCPFCFHEVYYERWHECTAPEVD